jgi:hypothetical protein
MSYKNILLYGLLLSTAQSFTINLEQARNQLSETKTYQKFDILSDEDKNTLKSMHVKYGEYAFNSGCNIQEFEACLTKMDNDAESVQKIAPILQKTCTKLSAIADIYTKSGIVAEDKATNFNHRVAWHIDISEEVCKFENRVSTKHLDMYKVLVNLQGTGTLFTELESQQKANFFDCYCKDDRGQDQDIVKSVQNMLKNNHQDQLECGEAVIFKMKHAVHSRPKTTENRAFLAFMYLHNRNDSSNLPLKKNL